MSRHQLSEIDLRHGDQRIRLRRGALKTKVQAFPSPVAYAPGSPGDTANAAPVKTAAADSQTAAPAAKKLLEIKSPTPGTFYARPSPDAEAFVKVGSRVEAKTVVCLIE